MPVSGSSGIKRIDQAIEQGGDGHLGAVAGTELVHGIAHMGFHRFQGDAQQISDGIVLEATGHRCRHIQLALGELLHQRRMSTW